MPGSLEDRLDRDFAPAWKPEPGGKIVGTVTEVGTAPGTDYGPYPVVTVAPADGSDELAVHCFHTVLRNEVSNRQPAAGDTIAIKYKGRVAGKGGGAEYESYRVIVEKVGGTPAVDWNAQAAHAQTEAAEMGLPAAVSTDSAVDFADSPF